MSRGELVFAEKGEIMGGLERFGWAAVAVLFVVIAVVYGAGLAAGTVPVPISALMLASSIGGLFVLNWSRR